jgi:hypothetical protein
MTRLAFALLNNHNLIKLMDNRMADRKEIFDYLRNQQKAAEIEAKVNGVNLWVLAGAIAIVGWNLILGYTDDFFDNPQLLLSILLCAEAFYLLTWLGRNSGRISQEIRYSVWEPSDDNSPFLTMIQGVIFLFPPVLHMIYSKPTISSTILGLFGAVPVWIAIIAISARIYQFRKSSEKFPKPEFRSNPRGEMLAELFLGALMFVVIFEQIKYISTLGIIVNSDALKQFTLIAAAYILALIIIRRKLHSKGIDWTYELEIDLLLENVSTEVAARRIEHRALGPKIQDVMDRFFDDIDCKIVELNRLLSEGREKIKSVKEIPTQYPAERAARIREATEAADKIINDLNLEFREFDSYLKKLGERRSKRDMVLLGPHLTGLTSRKENYKDRLNNAASELRKLSISN